MMESKYYIEEEKEAVTLNQLEKEIKYLEQKKELLKNNILLDKKTILKYEHRF